MAKGSLFDTQDAVKSFEFYLSAISNEINLGTKEFILNADAEDWKKYFLSKYEFLPLTIHTDQISMYYKNKIVQHIELDGHSEAVEKFEYEITIPFTGNSFLLFLRPTVCNTEHPQADISMGNTGIITVTLVMPDQDNDRLEKEKLNLLEIIQENTKNINADVSVFNASILTHFDTEFNNKKRLVLEE